MLQQHTRTYSPSDQIAFAFASAFQNFENFKFTELSGVEHCAQITQQPGKFLQSLFPVIKHGNTSSIDKRNTRNSTATTSTTAVFLTNNFDSPSSRIFASEPNKLTNKQTPKHADNELTFP